MLVFTYCGDDLLYTKRQQTGADNHAEHRGDDRRAHKDEHGDENEYHAADHLRVVIIDEHGSIRFETPQIRGYKQPENADHRDPRSQYVDDHCADKRLKKVAGDECRTKQQRQNGTDQLIILCESQRFSLLPDTDPAECVDDHEQSDDPCQRCDCDTGRYDAVDAGACQRDSDHQLNNFLWTHKNPSVPKFCGIIKMFRAKAKVCIVSDGSFAEAISYMI